MEPAINNKQLFKYQKGFSVMEMMLAMVIVILALTAVILVSFGNQTLVSDSQTNTEALNKAQELLENEQALARKDFNLVNGTVLTDGIYTKTVSVAQTNYFTKNVTVTVGWTGDRGRQLTSSLSGIVTNFEHGVGGNTCNSSVMGQNWTSPQYSSYAFSAGNLLPAGMTGSFPISGVDVYQNKMYVTVNNSSANNNNTFFIFNIPTPGQKPVYFASLDNAATLSAGLNAVAVATTTTSAYAYVASAAAANYNTVLSPCANNNGVNTACGQLQILDISGASPVLKYTFEVPSAVGSAGQAIGNSIFYNNGYVYLGLTKTSSGPEFSIIDVHNFPISPPTLVGSYPMGSAINAIYIKGSYAYLATPNARELTVLDISNPTLPHLATPSAGYDAPDSQGNGKSLALVGDTLYLGRTLTSANPEFYILNNSDPTNLQPNNTAPATQDIADSINGLVVRDSLAYLLTNHNFQIWRVDNTSSLTKYATDFTLPNSSSGSALDCEGNYLYAGSNDSSNNGYITVIKPGP